MHTDFAVDEFYGTDGVSYQVVARKMRVAHGERAVPLRTSTSSRRGS